MSFHPALPPPPRLPNGNSVPNNFANQAAAPPTPSSPFVHQHQIPTFRQQHGGHPSIALYRTPGMNPTHNAANSMFQASPARMPPPQHADHINSQQQTPTRGMSSQNGIYGGGQLRQQTPAYGENGVVGNDHLSRSLPAAFSANMMQPHMLNQFAQSQQQSSRSPGPLHRISPYPYSASPSAMSSTQQAPPSNNWGTPSPSPHGSFAPLPLNRQKSPLHARRTSTLPALTLPKLQPLDMRKAGTSPGAGGTSPLSASSKDVKAFPNAIQPANHGLPVKERRVVVKLPIESEPADKGNTNIALSAWKRMPIILVIDDGELSLQLDHLQFGNVQITSGHWDNEDEKLPETLDIFLPGREAWEEGFDDIELELALAHNTTSSPQIIDPASETLSRSGNSNNILSASAPAFVPSGSLNGSEFSEPPIIAPIPTRRLDLKEFRNGHDDMDDSNNLNEVDEDNLSVNGDSRDDSVYSNSDESDVLTNPSLEEESHHIRRSSKRNVAPDNDSHYNDSFDASNPRAVKPLPKIQNSISDKKIPFQFGATTSNDESEPDLSNSMAKLNAAAPVFQPSFSFHAPFEGGSGNIDSSKEEGIEPVKRARVDNGKLHLGTNSLTVHTEERALSPGALKMRTFKFPPDKPSASATPTSSTAAGPGAVDNVDSMLASQHTSVSYNASESSRSQTMSRSGRGVLPVTSSFGGGSRGSDLDFNNENGGLSSSTKFDGVASTYFSPNRPHAPIPASFPASVDGSFSVAGGTAQLGHQSMPSYHSHTARMRQVGRSSMASSNDVHKVHLVSDSESSMLSSSSLGSIRENVMPSELLNEDEDSDIITNGSDELDDEDEDAPSWQVFEQILDHKLEILLEEINRMKSFQSDMDSLRRDALLDDLTGLIESRFAHWIETPGVNEQVRNNLADIRNIVVHGIQKTHVKLDSVIENVMNNSQLNLNGTEKKAFATAIADAVKDELPLTATSSTSTLKSSPDFDLDRITEVVHAALTPVIDEIRSSFNNKELSKQVVDGQKSLSESVTADNENTISSRVEELASKISELMRPQIVDLLDVATDTSELSKALVSGLTPQLENMRQVPLDYDLLVEQLGENLKTSIPSHADIKKSEENTVKVITNTIREAEVRRNNVMDIIVSRIPGKLLEVDSFQSHLSRLTSTLNDENETLYQRVRSCVQSVRVDLSEDLKSVFQEVYSDVERLQDAAARVPGLEGQLVMAVSERDKLASEKDSALKQVKELSSRVDKEVSSLKDQLQKSEARSKELHVKNRENMVIIEELRKHREKEFESLSALASTLSKDKGIVDGNNDADVKRLRNRVDELEMMVKARDKQLESLIVTVQKTCDSNDVAEKEHRKQEEQSRQRIAELETKNSNDDLMQHMEELARLRVVEKTLLERCSTQDEKIASLNVESGKCQALQEVVQASEERSEKLAAQVQEYQERFSNLQIKLEQMKYEVARELQEGQQAKKDNIRLIEELELLRATTTSTPPPSSVFMNSFYQANHHDLSEDLKSFNSIGSNGNPDDDDFEDLSSHVPVLKAMTTGNSDSSNLTTTTRSISRHIIYPATTRPTEVTKTADGWWG